jgi:hypothetical protein
MRHASCLAWLIVAVLPLGCSSSGSARPSAARDAAAPDVDAPGADSAPVDRPADIARGDRAIEDDASVATDTTLEDDAESPEPDGPINNTIPCLRDGSGRFVLETSGGMTFHLARDNAFPCSGSSTDNTVELGWIIPTPGFAGGTGQFNLDITSLPAGETGKGHALLLSVLVGGENGNIWSTDTLCPVDIAENAPAVGGPVGTYRVVGALHCSAPVPGVKLVPGALTITRAEFTAAIQYR